jgi:alkylresorcinol/alkylpyrone synthase
LFLDSPIETRALYVPPDWWRTPRTLTDTNAAWKEGALALGGRALEEALQRTDTPPARVDLLAVTTVTGYATPGLDLLLAHRFGLREDLHRAHFNNIGCHAAVPLLRVAADHARARPGTRAIALAVEICSACFSPEADDPQSQVAAALFADGAAAAILSTEGNGPELVDFASAFDFEHIDALGFGLTTGGFRIVLDPAIPDHIGASIARVVDQLLAKHQIAKEHVSAWCLHPGGSRILETAQRGLGLSDDDLIPSRNVLRNWGNMSSPSVLFVLADALADGRCRPGTFGVLAAFGPGLGIEAALLRF